MMVLASLAAGLLFGLGLCLSGLGNPAKVQNFLDLFGSFDASLLLVMAGAMSVAAVAFRIVANWPKALLGDSIGIPRGGPIDARLALGSAVFGVGWGLAGFCPGPAMTALTTGGLKVFVFVVAMLVGIGAVKWLEHFPPK